ncbi:MAG: hypothetical protein Q9226_006526 [Calogaya cf. arnoldii]
MFGADPPNDIPDLSGKVGLITGGNTGLGKETILQLAKHNPAHLYLTARTPSEAEAAIHDIKTTVPNANITFIQLDLANLTSVKEASDAFLASSDRLDLLINNAGILAQSAGLTAVGYELQFGTNHIGHALLTKLPLPVLQKTFRQPAADVRIVCLSSNGYKKAPPGGIDFDAIKTEMAGVDTFPRYGQSKTDNILFASELARRYPSITSVSCHPGVIETELGTPFKTGNGIKGNILGLVLKVISVSRSEGANNQLWCATGKGVVSGRFYYRVGAVDCGRGFPDNKTLGKQLWDRTENEMAQQGYR